MDAAHESRIWSTSSICRARSCTSRANAVCSAAHFTYPRCMARAVRKKHSQMNPYGSAARAASSASVSAFVRASASVSATRVTSDMSRRHRRERT